MGFYLNKESYFNIGSKFKKQRTHTQWQ